MVALAEDLASRTRVWGALDTLENLKKGATGGLDMTAEFPGPTPDGLDAMAEAYEINCAPHNFYGHLASAISAHFCAASITSSTWKACSMVIHGLSPVTRHRARYDAP